MRQKVSFMAIVLITAIGVCRPVMAELSAAEFARAIVQLDTRIHESGKTVATLGATRSGSGVIIDASGLMVTVGYLVVEAESIQVTFNNGKIAQADVVATDHVTGLAILRAPLPAGVGAMAMGRSEDIGVDEPVVVLKHGGTDTAHVTRIADIREFAGSWEYYIDRAFYTSPATRNFSGAALVNRDAKLVGIGSLLLSDITAEGDGQSESGNLFIPIEYLSARLGALLSAGNSTHPKRSWLGVSIDGSTPDLQVLRVASGSPGELAGLKKGDALIAINNKRVETRLGFFQTLWAIDAGGLSVDLLFSRDGEIMTVTARTTSFDDWLVD